MHERDRSFSPLQSPEDYYVSAFPMALPTSFRLGIDQSDRSSVHDDSATSDTLAAVLTDTDSSRASSPIHSAAASISTGHVPFSIASTFTTSTVSSPSPSANSAFHSVGLSDIPSTRASILVPSHDELGLVVSGVMSSSESSATAIRTACKLGVRKRPSFHRYSWSPGLRDISARAIVASQGVDS